MVRYTLMLIIPYARISIVAIGTKMVVMFIATLSGQRLFKRSSDKKYPSIAPEMEAKTTMVRNGLLISQLTPIFVEPKTVLTPISFIRFRMLSETSV